ncbi:hypothetical protein [Brachybacterium subflavum]|uniref:hypothetical protein n=1 Tax=Brachybacterium subflavum TaxID=2585206 RepID=UPI001266593E|nr:hypothetical protein [Brachybacterium subflavum]
MKTRIRGIAKGLAVGTGSLALALSLAACGGSSSDDASGDDGGKINAGDSSDSDASGDDASAADDTSSDEASDDSSSSDDASASGDSSDDSSSDDSSASDDSSSDDSSSDDSSGKEITKNDEKAAVKNLKSFYVAMDDDDYEKACKYVKKEDSMGLTDETCASTLEQASGSYPDDIAKYIDQVDFKTKPKGSDTIVVTVSGAGDQKLYMARDDDGEFRIDLLQTGMDS